jgi:hypothetical protein
MSDRNVPSTSLVETIAGFTAGVISTFCLHPLDLIKTRLQSMTFCYPDWTFTRFTDSLDSQLIESLLLELEALYELSAKYIELKVVFVRFIEV